MTMTRIGSEFYLGSSGAFKLPNFPDVSALSAGGAVVAFNETQIFGPDTDVDGAVYFNILDNSGAFAATAVRANESTDGLQSNVEVHALANGNFVVTWTWDFRHPSGTFDQDAFLRLYDSTGTPLTGEIDITPNDTPENGGDDDEIIHDIIANPDGSFSVFYENDEWNNGWRTLVQQDFTAAGVQTGVPLKVDGSILFPSDAVRLTNGDLILSGIGPVYKRRDLYGSLIEGTAYNTNDGPARVDALAGGGFVLFFQTNPTVNSIDERLRYEVRANDGSLVFADEFFWDHDTAPGLRPQAYDVLALSSGGFVLAWQARDADAHGVYAQAFDADGSVNGSAVRVNDVQTGEQIYPELTELSDGNVMLVWQDASVNAFNGVDESARGAVFSVPASGGVTPPPPSGPTLVEGDGGTNLLIGTPGEDIILGYGGDDWLEGLGANDVLDGGPGIDTVTYENALDGVRVYLHRELAIGGSSGRDTLLGIEHVVGSDFRDVMVSNAGGIEFNALDGDNILRIRSDTGEVSRLSSGAGTDKIITGRGDETIVTTGAGDDLLRAGAGADTANMGLGNDVARMGADDDMVLGLAGDDRLFGNGGHDLIYGGADNDRLYGGAGADRLWGEDGDDALRGESGQDVLFGGLGDDNLYGGANRDTFVFSDLIRGGKDRIKDFEDGLDLLNFGVNTLGWTTFADVQAAASNSGSFSMKIDFGNGDQVVIENFRLSDFDAADVTFDNPF